MSNSKEGKIPVTVTVKKKDGTEYRKKVWKKPDFTDTIASPVLAASSVSSFKGFASKDENKMAKVVKLMECGKAKPPFELPLCNPSSTVFESQKELFAAEVNWETLLSVSGLSETPGGTLAVSTREASGEVLGYFAAAERADNGCCNKMKFRQKVRDFTVSLLSDKDMLFGTLSSSSLKKHLYEYLDEQESPEDTLTEIAAFVAASGGIDVDEGIDPNYLEILISEWMDENSIVFDWDGPFLDSEDDEIIQDEDTGMSEEEWYNMLGEEERGGWEDYFG